MPGAAGAPELDEEDELLDEEDEEVAPLEDEDEPPDEVPISELSDGSSAGSFSSLHAASSPKPQTAPSVSHDRIFAENTRQPDWEQACFGSTCTA